MVAYLQSRCPSLIGKISNFLRKKSRRLWKLHSEEFFRMLFLKTRFFFIRTAFKICGKTFKRLIYFPPDWRNCILFAQRNNLKWFFWRKPNLTSFFEIWMKNFLNFVENLWARSWKFLLWVQRYKFRAFLKNFNLNLVWDLSTCFLISYLDLSVTCSNWNSPVQKKILNLLSRKKLYLCQDFRTGAKTLRTVAKKSPWLSKLHCTNREVHFE